MEQKKLATFLIGGMIILIMGIIVIGSKNQNSSLSKTEITQTAASPTTQTIDSTTPVFFYGNTCPHCAEVEKWIEENKIEEKITIVKKEVYDDRQNSLELTQAAKSCGLPTDNIGVPFLYVNGKCFLGTPDVMKELSEKISSTSTVSVERSTQ